MDKETEAQRSLAISPDTQLSYYGIPSLLITRENLHPAVSLLLRLLSGSGEVNNKASEINICK